MTQNMVEGNDVLLTGFGAFDVRRTPQRTARNLRTMETVAIPERYRIVFCPSRQLLDSLNAEDEA